MLYMRKKRRLMDMDYTKITFIICANEKNELQECEYYINRLTVPKGYEIEILSVWEAQSMAAGYQEGMYASNAKYKVYLHQDVFIINVNFIKDILQIFAQNKQIGMIGCIGARHISGQKLPIHSWDTGKLFHNLLPQYVDYQGELELGEYQKVQVIDGFLMATQYDVTWREDLFQGWDFYDGSQAMEMWKSGREVVVPYQKIPWCYHDNKTSTLKNYYKDFKKFLVEYKREAKYGVWHQSSLEFEELQEQLKQLLDLWLEDGKREELLEVFAHEHNRKYLSLREYRLVADIERSEQNEHIHNYFWTKGMSKQELFRKLQTMRFLIKRLEFDAEEGWEYEYLLADYSKAAISLVIDEYAREGKKVVNKILYYQRRI